MPGGGFQPEQRAQPGPMLPPWLENFRPFFNQVYRGLQRSPYAQMAQGRLFGGQDFGRFVPEQGPGPGLGDEEFRRRLGGATGEVPPWMQQGGR